MAKREALRELQVRLAQRLQAAQSAGMGVAWLAVRAGGHPYLLPLGQAGEIVALSAVQPVPHAKDWFRGVQSVRGSLWGVVDLARFLAAHGATPAKVPTPPEASLVTLNSALEVNCGLLVDSLAGLRGSDDFAAPEPAATDAPAFYGSRWVDAQGQAWQEIQLRALAQSPPFLSIGA